MIPILLAYAIITSFVVLEGRARRGAEARSLERRASDRGTTRAIGLAFVVSVLCLLAAPALNSLRLGRMAPGSSVPWTGVGLALSGVVLRLWANRTLGRFYTRTLRVAPDQPVIRDGVYRVIRHPGYLGVLVMWLGAALATGNWVPVTLIAAFMVATYAYRIRAEERMLLSVPGYEDYTRSTWRLIPFVY